MTENKNETVKKAMISQPMAGKTDEEIAAARDLAVAKLRQMGYEVVNTLFTDEDMKGHSNMKIPLYIPLHYLAMSLESMSSCNVIYFCPGWENARGCRIEHDAAAEYGLEVMYG